MVSRCGRGGPPSSEIVAVRVPHVRGRRRPCHATCTDRNKASPFATVTTTTVLDFEAPVLVVLGGAFAACYWVAAAAVTVLPATGRGPLLPLGVAMAVAWSLAAGYLSSATLRDGDHLGRQTATHALLWVVLFGGTALVVAWLVLATVELAWPAAEPTTFWFGYVLVVTIGLGVVSIAAGSAYRLWTGRRSS